MFRNIKLKILLIMNKPIKKPFYIILTLILIAIFGISCGTAAPPIAMPSPPTITGVMSIEGQSECEGGCLASVGMVTVAGTIQTDAASDLENILVYITNASSGESVSIAVMEDGTFETEIFVEVGDLILMVAVDSSSGQSSASLSGVVPSISENVEEETTVAFVLSEDNDYDGDGHSDAVDAFPTDPTRWEEE